MRCIYDLDPGDWSTIVSDWDEPPYRASQIWQGLYQQQWNAPGEFSLLPRVLRDRLAEEFQFSGLVPLTSLASRDGQTIKTLFGLPDGPAVEAVLMKYDRRRTLCISTQAGCAMGCTFCATGQSGFGRHLSSGEIVAQVMYYARQLKDQGEKVTNIVVMGMGEPFHNYENTLAAVDRLNDQSGFNFGARRITISTVGLVPAIRRFTSEKRQVNLAISLHAADDETRSAMLPVNRSYPIEELICACREYVSITGRRITFEWALIAGVNDTEEQAERLASQLHGLLCHVNAIPLNPTPGFSGQATGRSEAILFRESLVRKGIPCTIRLRRGIEINAGCGQLVSRMKMKENN